MAVSRIYRSLCQEEWGAAGGGQRGGGASLRSADTAQVCSDIDFVVLDGAFECRVATAARQIVSERW